LEGNHGRREDESRKKKTMPLREVRGDQTYAQTCQAKNHMTHMTPK